MEQRKTAINSIAFRTCRLPSFGGNIKAQNEAINKAQKAPKKSAKKSAKKGPKYVFASNAKTNVRHLTHLTQNEVRQIIEIP